MRIGRRIPIPVPGVLGRKPVRGFTYIGLLFAVALLGVILAAAGTVWHTAMVREREAELLFIGQQYQKAITSYYSRVVNGTQQFPRTLDELLEDKRFPMPVRHLRRPFRDPLTGSLEWGLVKSGGRITGVYSRSTESPLRVAGFGDCCIEFEGAKKYTEWKFIYRDPTGATVGGAVQKSDPVTGDVTASSTGSDLSPSPVTSGSDSSGNGESNGADDQAMADFRARLARYQEIMAERRAKIAAMKAAQSK